MVVLLEHDHSELHEHARARVVKHGKENESVEIEKDSEAKSNMESNVVIGNA
ncbi:hypothetical protein JHK85_051785 [Glycine max]|nr:hypothetical protein JHK85_051785 [Glycine max]